MSNKTNLDKGSTLKKSNKSTRTQEKKSHTKNYKSESSTSRFDFSNRKTSIVNERVEKCRKETTTEIFTKYEVKTNKGFIKTKYDNNINNNFPNKVATKLLPKKEETPKLTSYPSILVKKTDSATKILPKPTISTPKQTITQLLNSASTSTYSTQKFKPDSITNARKIIKKTSLPTWTKISPSTSTKLDKNKNPGILYIFHHDNFEKLSNRIGSPNDVKLLEETFKKFNVIVETHDNPSVSAIQNIMTNVEKKDFSRHSCVVFAILSHGERNDNIHASKGGKYSIYDSIIFRVIKNKTLLNKPKILIVQACKGRNDPRFYFTDISEDENCGIPREILIFSSTFEGFVSYRSTTGTPFIRNFCTELSKFGDRKNIHDIMQDASKLVQDETGGLQIPTITITMTSSYVFGDHA